MISSEDAQDGGQRAERWVWDDPCIVTRLDNNASCPSKSPLPCQGPAEAGLGSGGTPVFSDLPHLLQEGNPSSPSPGGAGGIPLKAGRAAGVTTSLEMLFLPL